MVMFFPNISSNVFNFASVAALSLMVLWMLHKICLDTSLSLKFNSGIYIL